MDAFTIKDLENLSGIKAHTIRIWEQRYSFLKPQRTGTNIRYYSNDELKTLLNVALLNKYGFKISHISRMNGEQINERIIALTQAEAVHERIVNELITCLANIKADVFEEILNDYIKGRGIEKAISNVIFPLLEKIGVLWHTSRIIPAQEHIASNIIRQKFILGIENATASIKLYKTALLFLPEGEHHELGLLYMHYQFKSRGYAVLYLGADTPLADIKYIVTHNRPDFVYSHIISSPSNFNFEKFLTSCHSLIANTPLIITGKYATSPKKHLPPNIYLKQSLSEVMEFTITL